MRKALLLRSLMMIRIYRKISHLFLAMLLRFSNGSERLLHPLVSVIIWSENMVIKHSVRITTRRFLVIQIAPSGYLAIRNPASFVVQLVKSLRKRGAMET